MTSESHPPLFFKVNIWVAVSLGLQRLKTGKMTVSAFDGFRVTISIESHPLLFLNLKVKVLEFNILQAKESRRTVSASDSLNR